MDVNSLDIAVIAVMAAFAVYGAVKGLVRLVLGAASIACGILLACWFYAPVAAVLEGFIKNDGARRLAALVLIFFATIAAFGILIWLIRKMLKPAKLLWVDRLTGALLGIAVASLLIASALVPLTALLPPDSALVSDSAIAPHVLRISSLVVKVIVPDDLRRRFDAAWERLKSAGEAALPEGAKMPGLPEVKRGLERLKGSSDGAPADPNVQKAADSNSR